MKFLNRLVMGLLGILFIAAAVFMMGIYWNLINLAETGLEGMYLFEGHTVTAVASAVLLLLGLVLLLLSLTRSGGSGGRKDNTRSIVQYTETGDIRIALTAVENMVLRVSKQIKGIRDTETRVEYNTQGLLIYVKVRVLPDIEIPGLGSQLQEKVKEYVEEITGTSVAEVKVMVENIVTEQASPRKK